MLLSFKHAWSSYIFLLGWLIIERNITIGRIIPMVLCLEIYIFVYVCLMKAKRGKEANLLCVQWKYKLITRWIHSFSIESLIVNKRNLGKSLSFCMLSFFSVLALTYYVYLVKSLLSLSFIKKGEYCWTLSFDDDIWTKQTHYLWLVFVYVCCAFQK